MNRKIEHLIGLPINLPILGHYWLVRVLTHHEMIDEDFQCKFAIKASFSQFKNAFKKVDWGLSPAFRESLFTEDDGSEFHASIIRINNVGYKLTTYGFIRANILRRKKLKELNEAGIRY
jgi:hypothetical protein